MALEIHRMSAAAAGVLADRRLYLTADKSRVVEEGDAAAAFLLATPGTVISAADVAQLGLSIVSGRVEQVAKEQRSQDPPDAPAPSTPASGQERNTGPKRGR